MPDLGVHDGGPLSPTSVLRTGPEVGGRFTAHTHAPVTRILPLTQDAAAFTPLATLPSSRAAAAFGFLVHLEGSRDHPQDLGWGRRPRQSVVRTIVPPSTEAAWETRPRHRHARGHPAGLARRRTPICPGRPGRCGSRGPSGLLTLPGRDTLRSSERFGQWRARPRQPCASPPALRSVTSCRPPAGRRPSV